MSRLAMVGMVVSLFGEKSLSLAADLLAETVGGEGM
jgi:hypothetical protein